MARADRLTIRQKKRKVYSDFFTNFDKNEFSGYLGIAENEEAVRQAFKNLILTNHGERWFDSQKGGNISSYLFENVVPEQLEQIKFDIRETVKVYDPRITVHEIEIPNYDLDDAVRFGQATVLDRNTLTVRIVFSVVNIPDPLSVDVEVRRIR